MGEKNLVWNGENLAYMSDEDLAKMVEDIHKEQSNRINKSKREVKDNLANAIEKYMEVCRYESLWVTVGCEKCDRDMDFDVTDFFAEMVMYLRK